MKNKQQKQTNSRNKGRRDATKKKIPSVKLGVKETTRQQVH